MALTRHSTIICELIDISKGEWVILVINNEKVAGLLIDTNTPREPNKRKPLVSPANLPFWTSSLKERQYICPLVLLQQSANQILHLRMLILSHLSAAGSSGSVNYVTQFGDFYLNI